MNLQVCVPYQPCVYHCPMCIARGHKHQDKFENLFAKDPGTWKSKFKELLGSTNYDDVIITGECDPSQDMCFVNSVMFIADKLGINCKTEITTKNYNFPYSQLKIWPDAMAYSMVSSKDYLNSWSYKKCADIVTRGVLLLTKEMSFLTADNFSPMGFDQFTFKTLQDSESQATQRWIEANRLEEMEPIYEIIERYNGSTISVRLDSSCQDAAGRYEIFRSDGNLYASWESATPISI